MHISYRIRPSQHGNGFAVEAVSGVIAFCRDILKMNKLSALIDANNLASLKVAERAGFSFIKSSSVQGFDVDIYQLPLAEI